MTSGEKRLAEKRIQKMLDVLEMDIDAFNQLKMRIFQKTHGLSDMSINILEKCLFRMVLDKRNTK